MLLAHRISPQPVHDSGASVPASLLPEQHCLAVRLGLLRGHDDEDEAGGHLLPFSPPPVSPRPDSSSATSSSASSTSAFSGRPLCTRTRCLIFADLWARGYYLRSAAKFGADYLVYTDNPFPATPTDTSTTRGGCGGSCGGGGSGEGRTLDNVKVHAEFLVLATPWGEPIWGQHLTMFTRATETVRKTTVLASVRPWAEEDGGGGAGGGTGSGDGDGGWGGWVGGGAEDGTGVLGVARERDDELGVAGDGVRSRITSGPEVPGVPEVVYLSLSWVPPSRGDKKKPRRT